MRQPIEIYLFVEKLLAGRFWMSYGKSGLISVRSDPELQSFTYLFHHQTQRLQELHDVNKAVCIGIEDAVNGVEQLVVNC